MEDLSPESRRGKHASSDDERHPAEATAVPEDDVGGPALRTNKTMLTIAQVADQCAVSPKTVYRWLANDNLPTTRLPGAGGRPILRVIAADLEAWLHRHRHDPAEYPFDQRVFHLSGRRFIGAHRHRRRNKGA